MNKKKVLIIAASVLMLGAVAVKPAMAYFTDTQKASGTVKLGKYEITPYEEVEGMEKKISIKNTGDYPVYTRVKVFAGSTHGLSFETDKSTDWSQKGEYYYYDKILEVNATTPELVVKIDPKSETKEQFNVVVVEEACRVNADNSASWDEVSVNKEVYSSSNFEVKDESAENEGGAN